MSPLIQELHGFEQKQAAWEMVLPCGNGFVGALCGVLLACVAAVPGLVKIERRKGWVLLVLAFQGFALKACWIAHYVETSLTGPQASPTAAWGSAGRGPGQEGGGMVWLRPAEGLKETERTRKPILCDFTAEWCGFCEWMDAKVFEKADDAAKIKDRLKVKRMKAGNGPPTPGLKKIPTF